MQIIDPTYITDSTLIACDIPAATSGVPEWDDTYSYVTGQRVSVNYEEDGITPGVHVIYECTWHGSGNLNLYPPTHLTISGGYYWWTRVSATERWKLFDMIVAPDRANASDNVVGCNWEAGVVWEPNTVWDTTTYSSMMVSVAPGIIDSVALMNSDASTVSIIMDDPSAGEVYNDTHTPSTATYCNAIFEDLPSYPNATTTVIIRNYDGDVNVGEAIFGKLKTLGKTKTGVGVGITDYSQKQVDAFGTFSILERAFSKRIDCNVMMSTATHSGVMRILEKYRSVPLVWIISSLYSTTLIYGYYRDFKISIPNLQIADCSLSIEGLGGDLVNATPVPDPWVPPWDGIIRLTVPDFFTIIAVATPTTSKIEETPVAADPDSNDELALTVPDIIPTVSTGCYLTLGDCTISYASPAVVHYVAHGLLNARKIMFYSTGTLPAPLVAGQIYFVANKSDNDFNVSLTSGGSTIDTTNAGSGTHSLHPLVI